jgi:Concanavalin A-like lectin/glucanases superfamily
MVDPWELILHHSYTGTPGVIFDQSPGRGSHGTAVGFTDDDFLVDGQTQGSGAIRCGPGKRIRVPVTPFWRPCTGVRIEVLCICDGSAEGTLINGPNFSFGINRDGQMSTSFEFASGGGGMFTDATVPVGHWVTLAWMWDGLMSEGFWLNRQPVQQGSGVRPLASSERETVIGAFNSGGGQFSDEFSGIIDDIKVWRLNPHRINDDFTDRPVDEGVRDCWKQWARDFHQLMNSDPDCAETLAALLGNALAASVNAIVSQGDPLQTQLQQAAERYRELWSQGRLNEIPAVLADFIAALQQAGVDPTGSPEVNAFRQDPCVQGLFERMRVPDCDQDFIDMCNGVAGEE